MFMFLMYEYMYMSPHYCVLVLIKLVCIGLVRGCLHELEKYCSWFEEVIKISKLLWFSPFYGCLTRENGLLCIKV
jgi:hypothetical protein